MLIDQAEQVRDDVEALRSARRNRDRKNDFRSQHEKLRGLVQDVQPLANTLRVLRGKEIDVDYRGENLDQVVRQIETIREKFENDVSWIIQPENDLSDLDTWVRRHRGKIQRKIQSAWRDYYQTEVPNLSDDLLRVLKQFQDFREPVQTIRQLGGQLQRWKDDPPQTEESLVTFRDLAEERRATWEDLRSDEMSEDVLNFLVDEIGRASCRERV